MTRAVVPVAERAAAPAVVRRHLVQRCPDGRCAPGACADHRDQQADTTMQGNLGHAFTGVRVQAADGPRHPAQVDLAVPSANRALEQEADRVADLLVRSPGRVRDRRVHVAGRASTSSVQASDTPRQPAVAPDVAVRLPSLEARAQPLPAGVRGWFESRFAHDLSHVRVSTDDASARQLRARAYTAGSTIVFAAGQYDPATREGTALLAHELTHVLQQRRGGALATRDRALPVQRQPVDCTHAVTGVAPPRDPVAELTTAHDRALDGARAALAFVEAVRAGGQGAAVLRRSLDFHFATPTAAALATIATHYRRIVRRLETGTSIYRCNIQGICGGAGSDTLAAQRCPAGGARARICRDFFDASVGARISTLVHEAAHAVGVACADGDDVYIHEATYPGPNPVNNAEPYGEFARMAGGLAGPVRFPPRTPRVPPAPQVAPPASGSALPEGPTIGPPEPERPAPSFIDELIRRQGERMHERILESVDEIDAWFAPPGAAPPQQAPPQQAPPAGGVAAPADAPYSVSFTNVAPPASPERSEANPGPSGRGVNRAGYTRVRVQPSMTVSWGTGPAAANGGVPTVPLYVRSANVSFRLDPIVVHVSSRYPVGSCPYRVTAAHEQEHVTAFLAIFHRHRATMVRRANEIPLPNEAAPAQVPEPDIAAEQGRIVEPVAEAVREVRGLIGAEMRADRDAKDAPASYAQVYRRCRPDEW